MKLDRIVILLVSILLFQCSAPAVSFAFISPDMLSLIQASLGNFFWQFIGVVSVNTFLFFRNFRAKSLILTLSIIFLIMGGIKSLGLFNELRILNGVSDFHDKTPVAESEGEVDLMRLSERALAEYKIFQIKTDISDVLTVKNSVLIPHIAESPLLKDLKHLNYSDETETLTFNGAPVKEFRDIVESSQGREVSINPISAMEELDNLLHNVEQFAASYKLKKQDKVIFVCGSGRTSEYFSDILRQAGYQAYYAHLERLYQNENGVVSSVFNPQKKVSSGLLIVPYGLRDKSKKDVYVYFLSAPDLVKEFLEENHPFQKVYYKDVTRPELDACNVICSSNDHCLLTKYLLDHFGIHKRKIFKTAGWIGMH